jgi:hypothetical protein
VLASSDDVAPGHVEILHAAGASSTNGRTRPKKMERHCCCHGCRGCSVLARSTKLLLVACLASELDGKYARVYGCLHDDFRGSGRACH